MTECEYLDDQTKCRCYKYNKFTGYCMFYKKDMDHHCDNYSIQEEHWTRKENLNQWRNSNDGR